MGDTTFGKGLVQSVFPLDDGAALALTTAKYYTPDGHMIHNQGVPPHVVVEQDYPDTGVQEEILHLSKGDTVLKFVRNHPNPSKQEIDRFIERLREENGYTMGREYFLNRIHSKQLAMQGRTSMADPNTDHQLGRALEIFRRSIDSKPWSVSKAVSKSKLK